MERKKTMFVSRLVELLAPARCLNCEKEGSLICANCLVSLSSLRHGVCYRCNRLTEGGKTCSSCRSSSSIAGVTVGAYYDGAVQELVLQLKFHQARSAAELGAKLILAQSPPLEQVDLITAVPISPRRYRERGYNQAELIARVISKRSGVPYRATLTRESSDHQLGRTRSERLRGVAGDFSATASLSGERVLIVDDVVTTGATLNESARVLREAGATSVWGAVIARH